MPDSTDNQGSAPPGLSSRPLPSSFDDNADFYNENGFQKVSRRLREEPLIPLGCIATVAAFTGAYRAMRRGDHQQVQRMFRARVAAQAFTVIAMVAGSWYYAADRQKQKELWKLKEQQDAEEKRQKWIRELEVRDAEDKALQERLEKRKRKKAERDSAAGASDGVAAQAQAAYADAKEKASSLAGDVAPEDPTKSNTTGVRESLPTWLGGSKGADGSSRDKN
ncbi:hypoxia induced protein conserved region-domain-containing protein [Neurospora tetraspora]|uniref:Hypoxia induced protein conserved region-domain-containing protein n=1 Tax=Neurospora tetraspora TaxID=94610 RepID=A0AAE0MTA6_9PEZI|nr:hypoxia induced protein conserved region-domain-containing protein [Neurospora tetraspora]